MLKVDLRTKNKYRVLKEKKGRDEKRVLTIQSFNTGFLLFDLLPNAFFYTCPLKLDVLKNLVLLSSILSNFFIHFPNLLSFSFIPKIY